MFVEGAERNVEGRLGLAVLAHTPSVESVAPPSMPVTPSPTTRRTSAYACQVRQGGSPTQLAGRAGRGLQC